MTSKTKTEPVGLSLKTCAQQLDCSRDFIRDLCDAGELEWFRIGPRGMRRVKTESWKAYLAVAMNTQ